MLNANQQQYLEFDRNLDPPVFTIWIYLNRVEILKLVVHFIEELDFKMFRRVSFLLLFKELN